MAVVCVAMTGATGNLRASRPDAQRAGIPPTDPTKIQLNQTCAAPGDGGTPKPSIAHGFARIETPADGPWGEVTPHGYQIAVRSTRSLFGANDAIIVKVSIRNTTSEALPLGETYPVEKNLECVVKNTDWKSIAPLTLFGKWAKYGAVSMLSAIPLPAHTCFTYDYNVGKVCDMSMGGRYVVVISRQFWMYNPNRAQADWTDEVSSNPVAINVLP